MVLLTAAEIKVAEPQDDVDALKSALREKAKSVRAEAYARGGAEAADRLASIGLGFAEPAAGATVSGFWTFRDEIDVSKLLGSLNRAGHPTALPVMKGKGKPLVFKAWAPGDDLVEVVWGIQEPSPDKPVLIPDILLVPLLAFDLRGYRLGYGGGFYDRSLAEIRAHKPVTTIGVAFDAQMVDAVPFNAYDEPLDWVLTPSGPRKCSGR